MPEEFAKYPQAPPISPFSRACLVVPVHRVVGVPVEGVCPLGSCVVGLHLDVAIAFIEVEREKRAALSAVGST